MKSPLSLRVFLSLHLALAAALPMAGILIFVWLFVMPLMESRVQVHHEDMAQEIPQARL